MKRYFGISLACFCSLLLVAGVVLAKPTTVKHEFSEIVVDGGVVGNLDGTPVVSKAFQDTTWIADWNFDASCVNAFNDDSSEGEQVPGWLRRDFRILNDGAVYWQFQNRFNGVVADTLGPGAGDDCIITGNAAVLTNHDLCWGFPDGYGTNWYQGICIRYVGDSYLSFKALVDSESGFDFYQVETDSACASFARVNYADDPAGASFAFRDVWDAASGFGGFCVDSLLLTGYGTADTHCVYIAFFSDGGADQEDGFQSTTNGAALVVDDVVLEGAYPSSEDFDGTHTGEAYTYANLNDDTPFGVWVRVYLGITDNDVCTSNATCAWLDTDHTNPTFNNHPSQAFAPGGFVQLNWHDTILIGPWASLASTPTAVGTVLSIRRFPGADFTNSRNVQNWSVRGKTRIANTDTPAPGDSVDCVTAWGHAFSWNSLSLYSWITNIWDMSSFYPGISREVQVRFRQSDWRWIAGSGAPVTFRPAAGPFWDRVRIGRRVLTGPALNEGIDARFQAQDTAPNGGATGSQPAPSWGTTDIYDTASFSRATDLGINTGCQFSTIILGDSITMVVTDVRGAGGIASVDWYGCIVSGPHAGKAPPGYSIGANGFFVIPADTAYGTGGPAPGFWAVDIDDTYLRGGDVMWYFWLARDNMNGYTSDPVGMDGVPLNMAEAMAETGGLFETSVMPTINWDPAYLARIAADPFPSNGDLAPTQQELDNSSQKNCILYYNNLVTRRRSGLPNRTPMMASLDQLGYQGSYDVYDNQGRGNTNNQLGTRMSVPQADGYSLIIVDCGNTGVGAPIIPDGTSCDDFKMDQDQWFDDWVLSAQQGLTKPNHTLWLVGSNWAEEGTALSTLATANVAIATPGITVSVNPTSIGQAAGSVNSVAVNNPPTKWALDGGCPVVRNYDGLVATSGTAIETHTYAATCAATPSTGVGNGAVMVSDLAVGNIICQSHPWNDIRDCGTPSDNEQVFLAQVVNAALGDSCREGVDPTNVPGDDQVNTAPAKTQLYQNVPNPFNPVTKIKFDLARDGHVSLNVYDVAGRLVRKLLDEKLAAGRGHEATWNGLDNSGNRVSSGVYFYRLVAGDFTQTNKMVLMK